MKNQADGPVRVSEALRIVSKQAFGRSGQLEVALAAAELPNAFTFEELRRKVVDAANAAGVEPPSDSSIRKDLERIRDIYGAVSRVERIRGILERREMRNDTTFWEFCRELAARAAPAEG